MVQNDAIIIVDGETDAFAVNLDTDGELIDAGLATENIDDRNASKNAGGMDENMGLQMPNAIVKQGQDFLDEALVFCEVSQDLWQKGELESALKALDKAYSLILTVNGGDDAKTIQQKEDIRFMISKRILEIYASRNIVVNGQHNAIPLEMNRHIQAEIKLFTKGGDRSFFRQSYARSGRFREYIVKELRAAGLPEELSWLPLIESGFKVKALSRARALGPWQFIPSTGYKFGLKRNNYIDERIDPYKSTRAAIRYLKELHNIFGDWSTVLAAYNCGEGRVLRVIRSQNINYLDNFWDLYERLPRETARYVPKFLATLHMIKDPDKYGLSNVVLDAPLEFDTMEITRQAHLKDVAKTINVPLSTLTDLNPELRYSILPPEKYALRIPPGNGELLASIVDSIPISTPPQRAYTWHKIRAGESLSTIARKYRTSVSRIMRANNMRRSHYIVAGKRIKIPQKGVIIARAPGSAKSTKKVVLKDGKCVVSRGDSLWILAKRYGTTTQKIMALNNLSTTKLSIGQALRIPGQPQADHTVDNSKTAYLVKRGDSPYTIARQHTIPLKKFLSLNGLTLRSKIYPGQKVYIE
ncbi:MAG: LysM peptidoglycan-binding domain-containing protein [Desulfobacteraceae bacterium]|nr:LysM peptidoglycan-binding domain-containing protein [Desulfobacteraceae bacterium]